MRLVRWAVLASVAVAACGAGYAFRHELAHKLGLSAPANAAEQGGASPAASAQPQGRRGRANPAGAVPVVVVTAAAKPMPIVIEAVGTVQAIASIQIKPRLDSQIVKVAVEEGALVKEGDLLFELDQRTPEGAARPDRSADPQGSGAGGAGQARLLALRGSARQGRRNGGRARHRHDGAEGRRSPARVRRGATRRTSRPSCPITEIRAPVSGRIGSIPSRSAPSCASRTIPTASVLATINQVDPIYVHVRHTAKSSCRISGRRWPRKRSR